MVMKSILLSLALVSLGYSSIVVYDAQSEDCSGILYTEIHGLTLGSDETIDLSTKNSTSECIIDGVIRSLAITYGDLSDTLKAAKLTYTFSKTDTGYWNSKKMILSYNDGSADVTLEGKFPDVSFVGTAFSFACTYLTNTLLVSSPDGDETAVSAYIHMQKYQIQVYGVHNDAFADAYQCVNFISKGAWMGIASGLLMISVLVMSIMMLMSTSTPDRFETSKSKCLIIPHEH